MARIPDSHPRKKSLESRQKIVDGSSMGLLADSAMIAHAEERLSTICSERGPRSQPERPFVRVRLASGMPEGPVISVNGNTTVLAGDGAIRLAAVLGCPIEVNLYYRTPSRVKGLISLLEELRLNVSQEAAPDGFYGDWKEAVEGVSLLGESPNFKIEGLEGPRSNCTAEGIGGADTILVPLEDGDRCEALITLGKEVLVVDLNPLSRSARMASVTIVDEVSRAFEGILSCLLNDSEYRQAEWDNLKSLNWSLKEISNHFSV